MNRMLLAFFLVLQTTLLPVQSQAQSKADPGNNGSADNTEFAPSSSSGQKGDGAAPLAEPPAKTLSPEEQENLARKLYGEMSRMEESDLDSFITAHRKVIRECPVTRWAEESCWRLSNLYLMGISARDGKPDFDGVIECLELMLSRNPKSPLIEDAQKRLLIAYDETGSFQKIIDIIADRFRRNPQPHDSDFMTWNLRRGDACSRLGKKEEAKKCYEEVIQRDAGKNSFEAAVARKRLSGL